MYQYQVSEVSISRFLSEVCQRIIKTFMEEYMSLPDSREKWLSVAKVFEEKWQFPNCLRVTDGKHVPLINPLNSGSTCFNYKSFFSIVLLALVDADYKLLYVNVGCQVRISDGGVFKNSELYHLLVNGDISWIKPWIRSPLYCCSWCSLSPHNVLYEVLFFTETVG